MGLNTGPSPFHAGALPTQLSGTPCQARHNSPTRNMKVFSNNVKIVTVRFENKQEI